VGEVRGKEAYVMFQGMASGIPAIGTMHAGRVEDVIYRLETPPINLSPSLIDTLDMVIVMIHAREKGEAARRVKEIVEIEAITKETGKARTNAVYRWAPKEDKHSFKGVSWYLQQLAVQKGLETNDLLKELNRRKHLLEFIQKKGISNYKKVVALIADYRKNPAEVIEKIKSETEKL
jgi:flagellar protein FlaI